MMMVCQKCGAECERQSNRQKFCRSCSPHFPKTLEHREPSVRIVPAKRLLPDLICCHCGKAYGKGKWNYIDSERSRKPCQKCTSIVARKQAASDIRRTRRNKREMSRFGKWLLIVEEEAREYSKTVEKEWRHEDHLWTRRRYVSQQEIDEIGNRIRDRDSLFHGRIVAKDERPYDRCDFMIWRDTGGHDGYVSGPGWYRVEPLRPADPKAPWHIDGYRCVCASGIPYADKNNTANCVREIINKRYSAGREKAWQARRKRAEQERAEAEQERAEQVARRKWEQAPKDKSTRQFFTALAMAGAVAKIDGRHEVYM